MCKEWILVHSSYSRGRDVVTYEYLGTTLSYIFSQACWIDVGLSFPVVAWSLLGNILLYLHALGCSLRIALPLLHKVRLVTDDCGAAVRLEDPCRRDESITPYQPHRAGSGVARISLGISHKKIRSQVY